jgi:hypothetical protein
MYSIWPLRCSAKGVSGDLFRGLFTSMGMEVVEIGFAKDIPLKTARASFILFINAMATLTRFIENHHMWYSTANFPLAVTIS